MKHIIIFVPGLSGTNYLFEKTVKYWSKFGFETYVFPVVWKDNKNLQPKLKELINLIDKYSSKNNTVSLVGTSAGGSLVLNAFLLRKGKIHKVINVCGRLREGINTAPSLDKAASLSKSFKQSVKQFEVKESKLSNGDKQRILTVRALYDEVVPTSTYIYNYIGGC